MSADEGGDPACWAHLFEEASPAVAVDLQPMLAASGDGVHWTLPGEGDLNANLVRLEPGHSVGEHVNDEVDVLVVVLAGGGVAVVDGEALELERHRAVLLPVRASRSIEAGADGIAYLTVHRRRSGGLSIVR